MYITPNSTIELFSDIGLSGNYDNALYFSSTTAKDSYFSNITKIATLTNFSYVSQQKGIIKIGTPIAHIISVEKINTMFGANIEVTIRDEIDELGQVDLGLDAPTLGGEDNE